MSHSTELVAIFKLEFYKKKKNWVIGAGKHQLKSKQETQKNSLNETYTVDPDTPGPSLFNDAFLDSDLVPPDEEIPLVELTDTEITNNNCQDQEKYPNLNLTQNLEFLSLDSNPNLSKASVALAKLQNILRNDAENQLLDKNSSMEYEGREAGCCGPKFTYIGQTCPDVSDRCMQGWPRRSVVWTNAAYDYNEQEILECIDNTSQDTPDGNLAELARIPQETFPQRSPATADPGLIRLQVFSADHPESQYYQPPREPSYNKDLLRQHLEYLKMEEFCKFDQGDVKSVYSQEPPTQYQSFQESVGLGDSRDSLDGELFMLGAHRAPHSSEIELRVPRVFHKPRVMQRQLDHGRTMHVQTSFDLSHRSLTRSPSFDDFPTRDVDPLHHQDLVVAASFKDISDFDRYYVGRGRGRLLHRGVFGPGGWKP